MCIAWECILYEEEKKSVKIYVAKAKLKMTELQRRLCDNVLSHELV